MRRALIPISFLILALGCSETPPAADLGEGARGGTEEVELPEPEENALLRHGSPEAQRLGLDRELSEDFDGMLERRAVRAMVAYSKTSYFMDGLRQRGVAYELLKQFEEYLNEAHPGDIPFRVVPIPATRAEMFPAIAEGRADLALGGLTITPERLEVVDFSDPFVTGVSEIVVTGPASAPLASVEDLAGRSVYVRRSSSYFVSLEALNERFVADSLAPVELVIADEQLEDEDLLEMVNTGIVDAVVVDQYKAEFWDQIYDHITLHPDVTVRTGGSIGWAFRKNSPRLAEVVNEFVATHKKGTLMGNILFKRYLRDTKQVENVLDGDSIARYEETVAHFEEYAPQYDFDHLMMVAQGYQESKLDQSLVSHRGAVGIMQLLPTTAADDAVGIPNIEVAADNVHAGIRYMRWVRDTYFDDPAISDTNKTLMSFASYNAGPNRIRRLREETAERGLDPNVWFRNVEVLVAEDIGRETVDYVGNIFKYYAAYKLMHEREAMRSAE